MESSHSRSSGLRTKLGWAGVAGLVVALGAAVYRLELTRDLDILDRAGARIVRNEDGSPRSIELFGPVLSDANLKHVGRLERLQVLMLDYGRCSARGLAFLQSLGQLQELTLREVRCSPGSLEAIGTLANLESLTVENCGWVGDDDLRAISPQKQLHSLTLDHTSITDAGLEHLLFTENLKSLFLPNNWLLSSAGVMRLARLTDLKRLDVTGVAMTSTEFLRLHERLPTTSITASSEQLTDMQPFVEWGIDIDLGFGPPVSSEQSAAFDGCDVDNEVLTLLADRVPDLTHLTFGNTNLSDEHMPTVARFEKLTGLSILGPTGSLTASGFEQVSDLGLRFLRIYTGSVNDRSLEVFGRMRTLNNLKLSGPMTDAGVVHLRDLHELASLDLRNSRITGSTINELAGLKNLQRLNLFHSPITDAGLLKTADLSVSWLDIQHSAVTAAGLAQFRELRPDVHLFHNVGGIGAELEPVPQSDLSPETTP